MLVIRATHMLQQVSQFFLVIWNIIFFSILFFSFNTISINILIIEVYMIFFWQLNLMQLIYIMILILLYIWIITFNIIYDSYTLILYYIHNKCMNNIYKYFLFSNNIIYFKQHITLILVLCNENRKRIEKIYVS